MNFRLLYCLCFVLFCQFDSNATIASLDIKGKTETIQVLKKGKVISLKKAKKHQERNETRQWHLFAIAAAVFGLLSLVSLVIALFLLSQLSFLLLQLGVLSALWAVLGRWFAKRALRDINQRPNLWKGKKLAKTAFYINSALSIVFALIFLYVIYVTVSQD
jgi:F0F1-type ATP synthase assembly protein I